MNPIALITDFGVDDWFAGEMKGAILSACPGSTIVDITHGIPPGDIRCAAFTLAACYRTFPQGTVFCVVVDPGVGSRRKAIAADTGRYFFIGPDNGVLSWALSREASAAVRSIDNSDFCRSGAVGATFHGRDIFGPAAARCALAQDAAFAAIGAEITGYVTIPFPHPVVTDACIIAEILAVDRFGNAVTAIDEGLLPRLKTPVVKLCCGETCCAISCGSFFQEVPRGEPVCYPGSAGYLEIGINGGSAAQRFGLRAGDCIELRLH